MVLDNQTENPITEFEWRFIGSRVKRLQIPLPPTKDRLFNVCHLLDGFLLQLRELAKTPGKNTTTMLAAGSLVNQYNLRLKDLASEWETESREAIVPSLGGSRLNIRRPDSGDEGGQ